MPDDIRLLLADDDFTDPRQLAARADVLWHAKQQGEAVINTVAPRVRKAPRLTGAYTDETTTTSPVKATNKDKWCFYDQSLDTRSWKKGPPLTAANGSNMRTFGARTVPLNFNDRRSTWTFTIADVSQPLLGPDFLQAHSLLVNIKGRRLVNSETFESLSLRHAEGFAPHLGSVTASSNECAKLLTDFPDIITPQFQSATPKHGVMDHITTTGPPLHARARTLPPDRLLQAKEEFRKMEDMGIVRRSDSPWASPLHMTPKSSGGWRPCGDYRRLNEVTTADRYPIPHIQDFTANLDGAKLFSKIDLYAVQAFKRLMDSVGRCLDFVFIYLHDILIASRFRQKHRERLRQLLQRLNDYGLAINLG
ncbi:uncharacterized protein K02A2.6-like [Eriocheir sinensis]|uniref:uncharacterized protein K02A2.6-like n=1 Tax=Eriocheir sinensis TaxID=95602 RepID=UPI0021C841F8|nr:uncharacterized protein K02A2.6-like [Eriocheir sinensis]